MYMYMCMYTYLYSLLFPHVYVYVYCPKFFHLEKDIFAFLRQTSANLMFIFSGTCCSTLVRKILHSVCLDCLFGCLLGCFCFVFFFGLSVSPINTVCNDRHSLQREFVRWRKKTMGLYSGFCFKCEADKILTRHESAANLWLLRSFIPAADRFWRNDAS